MATTLEVRRPRCQRWRCDGHFLHQQQPNRQSTVTNNNQKYGLSLSLVQLFRFSCDFLCLRNLIITVDVTFGVRCTDPFVKIGPLPKLGFFFCVLYLLWCLDITNLGFCASSKGNLHHAKRKSAAREAASQTYAREESIQKAAKF